METTPEIKKIELEEDTLKDLDTTRKWSMFIAILGFIAIGLMLLIGLIAGVFLSVFKTQNVHLGTGESILIFGILLVIGVIYFFPILFLYRFSKHAGNAVRTLDKEHMRKAFRYLRKYYVFIGILTIVILVVYVIALIASGASLALLKDLGTGI
jgi:MFS family permease